MYHYFTIFAPNFSDLSVKIDTLIVISQRILKGFYQIGEIRFLLMRPAIHLGFFLFAP